MRKILALVAFLAFLPHTAHAADAPPAVVLQNIIEEQLQAFAADDAAGAYGYAAPLIQRYFPTTDDFMAMVKKGYQPVYRNTAHRYGDAFVTSSGQPAQKVFITGADGKIYEATYSFEQQPDGSWKISGCFLAEVPGVNA
jgi:ketosteroid isomerase-like protein